MESKNKRTFLEAFIFTIVVFVFGILIGMSVENKNINDVNEAYLNSQVTMFDMYLASSFIDENSTCDFIKEESVKLANRIYKEAELLEKYEEFSEIFDNIKVVHRKYDVLRTMLWDISGSMIEKCSNYNIIVYLYEYETKELTQQAYQNTWSRFLNEIKEEYGDNIILIPIAVDQELVSLDAILDKYEIDRYPVVIINNKKLFYDIPQKTEFEKLFK